MSIYLKIVLAEPSLILRSGMSCVLRRLTSFDIQVVETSGAERLEALIDEVSPDVLFINPSLADEALLEHMRQRSLRSVAFQSALADVRLMRGFDAVVSIYDTAEQIKEKLSGVCRSRRDEASQELLSAREKEIIVGVAKGLTNRQIAERLFLSAHTVITHRRNIAAKLQIHSPAGLTIYAIVNRLVELNDVKKTIYSSQDE